MDFLGLGYPDSTELLRCKNRWRDPLELRLPGSRCMTF